MLCSQTMSYILEDEPTWASAGSCISCPSRILLLSSSHKSLLSFRTPLRRPLFSIALRVKYGRTSSTGPNGTYLYTAYPSLPVKFKEIIHIKINICDNVITILLFHFHVKGSTLNDNRKYTVTEEGKGLGERVMWINVLAFEPLSILNCMQNCNHDDYLIILDHILQSYMISKVLSNTTL